MDGWGLSTSMESVEENPLVSIIIPAFNAEDYLAIAINSALAQTYTPIEIIVVNDGSTDDTLKIANAFGAPVRVITQDNKGCGGARNKGFSAARGSIIALLDADDQWMPTRLERCVEVLKANPEVGLVTTDAYLIKEGKNSEIRYYGGYQKFPFPKRENQLDEIAKRNFVFVSAVFDRRILELVGGGHKENLRACEDYELWARFLIAGSAAALVDEPLAYYSVRPDSLSRAKQSQWEAHISVLEMHLPTLWLLGARGRPQDAADIGISLARCGERRLATWFLFHSLSDPGANIFQRSRFFIRGGAAIIAGRNTRSSLGSEG